MRKIEDGDTVIGTSAAHYGETGIVVKESDWRLGENGDYMVRWENGIVLPAYRENLRLNTAEYAKKRSMAKATAEQQLGFLTRDVLPVLRAVSAGYDCDPGSSDLDDEQPVLVRMTLGNYRRAARLLAELERV